jgi:hypothetical protein
LKRKEETMTRVANLMTKTLVASKGHHDKRTEQMQLVGCNTTTIYYVFAVYPRVKMAILLGYL